MRRYPFGSGLVLLTLVIFALSFLSTAVCAQEIPYTTGTWDADSLGNHRVVVRVSAQADAAWAHIPWRRRDHNPQDKKIIVVEAQTGNLIKNVVRVEINREFGDLVFQPQNGPGDYYVYYLPYAGSKKSNYPKIIYPKPEPTAQEEWLRENHLQAVARSALQWQQLPRAQVVAMQSIDEFNSFWPMEVIATQAEVEALQASQPQAAYVIFAEDRKYPIRMREDLPLRWIQAGPASSFRGEAMRGEFYAFQIGVYALRQPLANLQLECSALNSVDGQAKIPALALRCINLGGNDWTGKAFSKTLNVEQGKVQALWCGVEVPENTVPGEYRGTITIAAAGLEKKILQLTLVIAPERIAAAGDNEPWRHSRLRWLDSRLAFDDEVVQPFTPVQVQGNTISILGRRITLAANGLPQSIASLFAIEMTHLQDNARELLISPMELLVEDDGGRILPWQNEGLRFVKQAPGRVVWEAENTAGALKMKVHAELECDGTIEYEVALHATQEVRLNDIRLHIPFRKDAATYMMGLGLKGGYRPQNYEWTWDVKKNQDGAWIGDVNAGLQFGLKDENYSRPLNTNFYHAKPLLMPSSWCNAGRGGIKISELARTTALVNCYSGSRVLRAGEVLHYNFRMLLTPFKPIDPQAQWRARFYHRFDTLEKIAATGANTVNVHHATAINPYINYPFLRPQEMKAYIDEAHQRGMKVKIYNTVRELSNRAPELFALRSLGDEIFSTGPGGGVAWLQEHLDGNYIAAWFVPELKDAAIINSGFSRWHNYYVEGLNWLVQNVGIDGLYIDDVAYDRTTMKRVRKVLDRGHPGALIDLHSANQYNPRDGFSNSANLYLEHFPYINRLWFGEYFDYNSPPDFWLIEVSGIPYGLMGEMLEKGGNPWRGMIYGMTSRLPWAGDPTPIWKVWDAFGMQESRMLGYWVPQAPVKTNHAEVLATSYVKPRRALIALASWANDSVRVKLNIDWKALQLEAKQAKIIAPAVKDFQDAHSFLPTDEIPIAPGRGWLLLIEEQ